MVHSARLSPALTAALRVCAAGLAFVQPSSVHAGAPIFSITWQGAPKGAPDACFGFPVREGDLLEPGAPPFVPLIGPSPGPCIVIGAGLGPPVPGLGLPLAGPAAGLPAGVPGGVEVDALSFGADYAPTGTEPPGTLTWAFGVSEFTPGAPGVPLAPNVFTQGPLTLGAANQVSAQVFRSIGSPAGPACASPGLPGNTVLFDGNGLAPPAPIIADLGLMQPNPAAPGVPDAGSSIDAIDVDPPVYPGFMPGAPPGVPYPGPVYFSLEGGLFEATEGLAGSGSAAANGFLAGDIIVTPAPGAPPLVWAPAGALGLTPMDDVDALAIWDNGDGVYSPPGAAYSWVVAGPGATDFVVFSLRPGSPSIGLPDSLCGVAITANTLLWPPAPGSPAGTTPRMWLPPAALGLTGAGNLNALDLIYDCNTNGTPDNLEVVPYGILPDCNENGRPDDCDIASGAAADCNANGVPDSCEIAAGAPDCNRNGVLDVCEVAAGTQSDCNANGVLDICDTHPMNMSVQSAYGTGPGNLGLVVRDVDGDARPEFMLLGDTAGGGPANKDLVLARNDGAGGVSTVLRLALGGAGACDLTSGDFDADGLPDLVVAQNVAGATDVRFLQGIFAGLPTTMPFVPTLTLDNGVTAGTVRVAVGDVNGDGRPDIVTGNLEPGAGVTVFRNTTVGSTTSFAAPVTAAFGGMGIVINVADYDGDSRADVIASDGGATFSVLRSTSTTTTISFALAVNYTTGGSVTDITGADVTGDGRPEIIVARSGLEAVLVYQNTSSPGSISVGALQVLPTGGMGAARLAVADFTFDQRPDIAVTNQTSETTSVFRHDLIPSSLAFAAPVQLPTLTGPREAVAADMDGDGDSDLLINRATGLSVLFVRNDGIPLQDCNLNGLPDSCEPDSDGDGVINDCDNCVNVANPTQADADGDGNGNACEPCPADLTGNNTTNTADLVLILGLFGTTVSPPGSGADYNADGVIDTADLVFLLGNFGC